MKLPIASRERGKPVAHLACFGHHGVDPFQPRGVALAERELRHEDVVFHADVGDEAPVA